MAAAAAAARGRAQGGGAVPFCAECHALLDLPDDNPIVCRVCKYETTFQGEKLMRAAVKGARRYPTR